MLTKPDRLVLLLTALLASALIVLASGCGGGGGGSGNQNNVPEAPFAASRFGAAPARGANKWLPLRPGTQWVREGRVNVGHRRLPHRVVSTVTDVSRVVDGVRTVAVLDQDYNGGQVGEQSVDYLAEDKRGNVWDLGSYTETYEGGQFVNAADARLSGVKGSKPAVLMKADPRVGDKWPAASVVKTNQPKCVPFKCYKGTLVIAEGGGAEYKYFAPGVGQLSDEPKTGGGKQEVEALINLTRLSPRALSEISKETLKLDRHARTRAKDVFGRAPAAKRTL